MISIKNLSKKYGTIPAVSKLSWDILPGTVTGLLGPNGAGKTTTMRMITGFLEPDEGEIFINNKNIADEPQESRKKLGYLPENNPLYDDMLVSEYLDFVARLKGLTGTERKKTVQGAAKETGIESVFVRPIHELSKGYRQRVGLAQAILHHPDILILDEPTEGLDPNQRHEIRELIKTLGKSHTVILSTHVMQEVEATCDRVVIMNHGTKITEGSVNEIKKKAAAGNSIAVEMNGQDVDAKISQLPGIVHVEVTYHHDDNWKLTLMVNETSDLQPRIFELAKQQNWTLLEMRKNEQSLEDIFRELTK